MDVQAVYRWGSEGSESMGFGERGNGCLGGKSIIFLLMTRCLWHIWVKKQKNCRNWFPSLGEYVKRRMSWVHYNNSKVLSLTLERNKVSWKIILSGENLYGVFFILRVEWSGAEESHWMDVGSPGSTENYVERLLYWLCYMDARHCFKWECMEESECVGIASGVWKVAWLRNDMVKERRVNK